MNNSTNGSFCDACGKVFPTMDQEISMEIQGYLSEVTTCSDCLAKKLRTSITKEIPQDVLWGQLQRVSDIPEKDRSMSASISYESLVEWTRSQDEHPEAYNGYCECRLCMSYA